MGRITDRKGSSCRDRPTLAQLVPRLRDGAWIVVSVDVPLLIAELLHVLRPDDAACVCIASHALPMGLRLDARVRAIVAEIGAQPGRERSLRALHQRLDAVRLPS